MWKKRSSLRISMPWPQADAQKFFAGIVLSNLSLRQFLFITYQERLREMAR